ncbi:DNA mismatch repair protein Vsr [Arthrobacter sp. AK-YN10]|nr:DNA mismatch repair protein Vsr [Arthrobacter sp. AK-YN10]
MQGNRSRDTKPELAVRKLLHSRGFRYRVSQRPIPALKRTADLIFSRPKVAVFIDGCFWHGCPCHYRAPSANAQYWVAKLERNRLRDIETTKVLQMEGWTVLRFWAHEEAGTIADRIEEIINSVRIP